MCFSFSVSCFHFRRRARPDLPVCRYEAELRKLLDDLKGQRDRERERVRELIVARRNKQSLAGASSSDLQREEARMMRDLDEDLLKEVRRIRLIATFPSCLDDKRTATIVN